MRKKHIKLSTVMWSQILKDRFTDFCSMHVFTINMYYSQNQEREIKEQLWEDQGAGKGQSQLIHKGSSLPHNCFPLVR